MNEVIRRIIKKAIFDYIYLSEGITEPCHHENRFEDYIQVDGMWYEISVRESYYYELDEDDAA